MIVVASAANAGLEPLSMAALSSVWWCCIEASMLFVRIAPAQGIEAQKKAQIELSDDVPAT